MEFNFKQAGRLVTACILSTVFAVPQSLMAQAHVVSPSEMQSQVVASSQVRQQNIEKVRSLFSSAEAERALQSSHISAEKVKAAVATLDDADLAQLAARADKAQHDMAAGSFSNRDLLILIIGVAVVVLIIVAVR